MAAPQTFETDRLILRPTTAEDAAFLIEILNTPKFLKYVGDRKVHTEVDARKYIAERITPQHKRLGYSNYTVIRKSDGAKMGTCGLFDRPGVEGVDIGYGFLPQYEKQGYAYEAACKVREIGVALFHLNPINAYTSRENLGSQGLLEKLGFQYIRMVRFPDDEEEIMQYRWEAPNEVDAYIANFPAGVREMLTELRACIKTAAPDAKETIAYQMPAYKLKGVLVYFAAFKNHIGFYLTSSGIAAFREEFSKFKWSKGAVQFPLDQPLPLELISKIVAFRVMENLEKVKRKKAG